MQAAIPTRPRALALALAVGLGGCGEAPMPGFLSATGAGEDPPAEVTRGESSFAQAQGDERSLIIARLLARETLLQPGSPYDAVAKAALAASRRSAEAELQAAKLRAEAKSKNWLPSLSPGVSLTSLGDLVASILLEQVLFDNGRRKAERAFAAADVEVAAVTLAIDLNDRVETALALYLTALRGDEKAALFTRALGRMAEFRRVVQGRVDGGISDRADLRVVMSKIDDIEAARTTAEEAAAAARVELNAMTGHSFAPGFAPLTLAKPPAGTRHLDVLLAEAEGRRAVAQTRVERAGLLPKVAATATVTEDGTSGALTLDTDQPLGFGTPAALKAIAAAEDTATRRVAEADEDARRAEGRQAQRLASFRRQEAEAAGLARQSRETFRLFQAQFKAGQRTIMDVVSIYEELVQREQAHVDAKYQVILIQLEMARDRGLLADGDKI
ncbi:MAG: TolC family protein [Rhodobacter sp.]|nr:TolC family protein [Rhodobacter sp.]